jgi:peptide/nickel transport system permease protein
MWRLVVRRSLLALPVLRIVSFVSFIGMELVPGDTLSTFFGQADVDITQEQLEALEREYGLDRPLLIRYGSWLTDVFQGELGTSLSSGRPVAEIIPDKLFVSIWITSTTLVLNIVIGVFLGLLAGVNAGGKFDMFATFLATWGIATPNFWVAILLIIVFSLYLDLLPASGWVSPMDDPVDAAKHLILPILSLGLLGSASVMRQTRSSMIEVLSQDYVRTARAKGLTERAVVVRHAMRNAMIPVVTVATLQLSFLVGGSVLIEQVFALPGLGRLAVTAVQGKDYPVIQMIVLMAATAIVISNLLADILYAVLDPRIEYA